MKNLVNANWLNERLDKENMVIIDCRFELGDPEYGRRVYEKSHIKNAVFVDLEKDLTGEVKEHGGRHPLPDINKFANTMESLGISDKSTVVIYDDGDLPGASRLWWMLKYIGKDNVYVLEGGFSNWIKLGLETQSEVRYIAPGKLTVNLQRNIICDMKTVKEALDDRNTVIVDSRARERYLGIVEPIDKKAGHIPGSVNYFWQDVLNGTKLKDENSLRDLFRDLMEYSRIIVHCGSGITACPNILAMDEIGLKPVLYLGGWSDWISYEDNEVVAANPS